MVCVLKCLRNIAHSWLRSNYLLETLSFPLFCNALIWCVMAMPAGLSLNEKKLPSWPHTHISSTCKSLSLGNKAGRQAGGRHPIGHYYYLYLNKFFIGHKEIIFGIRKRYLNIFLLFLNCKKKKIISSVLRGKETMKKVASGIPSNPLPTYLAYYVWEGCPYFLWVMWSERRKEGSTEWKNQQHSGLLSTPSPSRISWRCCFFLLPDPVSLSLFCFTP